MLKTLTTAAGIVLMASSFALAGQTATKPTEQPKVASQSSQTATPAAAKKHHKKHKKHHKKTNDPSTIKK